MSGGESVDRLRQAAATAVRPSGKVYRRRKPPTALVIDWNDECSVVIVERTHDVDKALPLARAAWRRNGDPDDKFPADDAHREWLRLVPWDAIGSGADSTYLSVGGDEPGAYPCVRFGGSL